jgi:hypothetical protein
MYNHGSCILGQRSIYYTVEMQKERSVIPNMTDKRISVDLDDLIFADCDWQPSER